MAAYAQQNSSRRLVVLGTIIAFHVLLGYGLVSGLARKVVEVIAPPLVTDIIEEMQQEDKPPPPPPPQMERPPVEVPAAAAACP
jgi:protein TonB